MKSPRAIEILLENKNFMEAWAACRNRLQNTHALSDQILAAKVFFEWYYMNRGKKSYLWLAALCLDENILEEDMEALQKPEDSKGHENPGGKLLEELKETLQTVQENLDNLTALGSLSPSTRADFYLTRGHVRRNLNNLTGGEQDYRQVIQIHTTYRQNLTGMQRLDKPEATLAELTKSAALAWRMLAELCRDRGERAEELSALAEAAKLTPDDPVIHSIYGDRLCGYGYAAEAIAELEIAVQCRLQHSIEAKTLRGAKITWKTEQLKAMAEEKQDDERSQFRYAQHLVVYLQDFRNALPILEKLQERWPDHPDLPPLLASAGRAVPKNTRSRGLDLTVSGETSPDRQLWQAAATGNVSLVKALREQKVDLTTSDEKGNTALHYAAKTGQVVVIPILYRNYNTENKQHQTPIQVAAAHGQLEMVKKLLEQGVNLAGVLQSAIIAGQIKVIQSLLDSHYPYRNHLLEASGGLSALVHMAIDSGQTVILRFLVESEPGCRDALYQGQTPLHQAVHARSEAAIDVLFDLFAHPLQRNEAKLTPGELAKLLSSTVPKHAGEFHALTIKLDALVKQRHLQEEIQLKNIAEIIQSILKELAEEKEWSFLGKKPNPVLEKILRDCFSKNLHCQRHLCQPQSDLSVLKIHLKMQILAAQSSVLKINSFSSNELLEAPLRRVILAALFKPWQPMEAKELEEEPGSQDVEEIKLKKSDQPRALSREQIEFVNQFEDKFDAAYSKFRALQEGDVIYAPDDKDQMAGLVKTAASVLPSVSVPIPGVSIAIPTGKVVSAAVDISLYMRNRWRKQNADRMYRLFEACLPSERNAIIRFAAVCLADKYRHQLSHLESGEYGISRFAACAANRVIDYIISNDKHQIESEATTMDRLSRYLKACFTGKEIPTKLTQKKSLCSLFLDGMLRMTEYPGDIVHLRTVRGLTHSDQWTSKGLIENTGIITPDGERFSHPACRVDIYGYVSGTAEEAELRGLTNTDPKTKESWKSGRQWELPPETPIKKELSGSGKKEDKYLTPGTSLSTAARQGLTFTGSSSSSSSSSTMGSSVFTLGKPSS